LFRSAVRLGVAGADQVVAALDPALGGETVQMPAGLTLSLQTPFFSLASDDHTWVLCFPYYFMPAPVGRQTLNNGVVTELAVVSTLVAPDSGIPGASQATIMIAAAPAADSLRHVAMWIRLLDVRPVPAPRPVRAGQWFQSATDIPMRREAVVIRLPQRVLVIAYSGLPGTFETNRTHFLAVVRTVAPQRCAT
jgi:hypothetical protein